MFEIFFCFDIILTFLDMHVFLDQRKISEFRLLSHLEKFAMKITNIVKFLYFINFVCLKNIILCVNLNKVI